MQALPAEMAMEDEQLKKELEDVKKEIEGYETRSADPGRDKKLDELLEKNLAALREKEVLLMKQGMHHPPLHQQLDGTACFSFALKLCLAALCFGQHALVVWDSSVCTFSTILCKHFCI